jgi:hypothetical protein
VEALSRAAHNPRAKRRLKRLVSEVGINIVPEHGTSLLRRSSLDPSFGPDGALAQRSSGSSRYQQGSRNYASFDSLDGSLSKFTIDDPRLDIIPPVKTSFTPGEKDKEMSSLVRESEQMLMRDSLDISSLRKDRPSFDDSVGSTTCTPLFEHFLLVGVTSEVLIFNVVLLHLMKYCLYVERGQHHIQAEKAAELSRQALVPTPAEIWFFEKERHPEYYDLDGVSDACR